MEAEVANITFLWKTLEMLGNGDMSDVPDVSVIIVNYNVTDYLRDCLTSIYQSESGISIQVIVVDNNSRQDPELVLSSKFPQVEWIRLPENVGFAKGNNRGLEACGGRYIFFLNPDTIISPETIPVMVRFLDARSDIGLLGCKVLNSDGTFQNACRRGFPTPWAAFCKLFGLQTLFPNSKLFAGYNLTFMDENQEGPVDAISGCCMMGSRVLIQKLGGYDERFFMYGEDLDLCYRVAQEAKQVYYLPLTSIIHHEGKSAHTSELKEIQIFYGAMKLFAEKHFKHKSLLMPFIKVGINIRSLLERVRRRVFTVATCLTDVSILFTSFLLATTIRFGGPFALPDYAYPTVVLMLIAVFLFAQVSVGEYIEFRPTMRRTTVGLLLTFFGVSVLWYFFRDYAFSRGVLIMTVGFSTILVGISRGLVSMYELFQGSKRVRRIILVGPLQRAQVIIDRVRSLESMRAQIVGLLTDDISETSTTDVKILGSESSLQSILESISVDEVIVTAPDFSSDYIMKSVQSSAKGHVRFHLATSYDELLTARIIADVTGRNTLTYKSPIDETRNRWIKRAMDILVSITIFVVRVPLLIFTPGREAARLKKWVSVFRGKLSVVGLFPVDSSREARAAGVISLVHVFDQQIPKEGSIKQLNDYYLNNYSIILDIEIMFRYLTRRIRGQHYKP